MIEWEKNSPKNQMTWDEAKKYAKSLDNGWKLPTKEELLKAYKDKIPAFITGYYWSSCAYDYFADGVWLVSFKHGNTGSTIKTDKHYVCCVRKVDNS